MNRSLLLFVLVAWSAIPQPQPQLVWEGEVDGVAILHIRDNRLDIEDRQGAPVGRQRHRFADRLPQTRQDVRLQVGQARGAVRIVQQPRPENNHTLSVQIEDTQPGAGYYAFAFFWQESARSGWSEPASIDNRVGRVRRPLNRGEDRLSWTGRVDDEVLIVCRGRDCRTQALRGTLATREQVNATRPLPDREVRVSLDDAEGRGTIELVEQPSPSNGFSASLRIRDVQGGAGDYAFSLYWTEPRGNEPERLFPRPGAVWAGRVDGAVRVSVEGSQASTQTVGGAPVGEERFRAERPLPSTQLPNLAVRKLRGRGRVEIVEFPSNRNGGHLIFEVCDDAGGSDLYEVEIGW